ncbi:MAG: hypothetical protein IKE18_03510 [Oscillospiraceae bacterium]|nr:hypothetical protein [Oscillospiraceae bacterium]MBR2805828.1 hypothetical protein [Oscillospiraceae bacterium]
MSLDKYDNPMLRQMTVVLRSFERTADFITFDYLAEMLPKEVMEKTNKVVLTGAGDSYCAGIAAEPVFEGYGKGIPAEAVRAIEYTRYYNTYVGWDKEKEAGLGHTCIAISNSGKPVRVIAAMKRAKLHGCEAIAITSNFESEFAKAADHIVKLDFDPFDNHEEAFHVNVINYVTSCFTAMMVGLYINVCKGNMTLEQAEEHKQACIDYVKSIEGKVYEELDRHAMDMTERWEAQGVDLMDFVGDGPDYATAFFGSAKMIETFGGLTTYDDSEDWNHINFFNRSPEKVGTFVVANESSPAFSRQLEMINTAVTVGRPVCVITDADRSLFPENCDVFTMPKPKYAWINPLMQHLPMDFVAGYVGAIRNIQEFCFGSEPHQLDFNADRFRKSKMVVL